MYGLQNTEAIKRALLTAQNVDHFFGLDTTQWNTIQADDNATVAIDADGVGGVAQLAITTDDNEEAYLYTNEIFKIQDGKPILVTARIQYTEGNTDDANVMFGLMDGIAANALQDDGAGPKASFTGGVFYKVDGETRWRFGANNAGSTVVTELDYTAGGSSYQTLSVLVNPISSNRVVYEPLIDVAGGNNLKQCRQYNVNPRVPLVSTELSYSSPTEMALVFGIKNGGANTETLNVDLAAYALNI